MQGCVVQGRFWGNDDDEHATGVQYTVNFPESCRHCFPMVGRETPGSDPHLTILRILRLGADLVAHGVIPNPLAMDVKTTDDSRTDIYMRQFFQLDYDLQAAHYRAALKAFYGFEFPFLHAVVEDQEPHAANIIGLEPEVIANGEAKRRDALNLLKKCRDADEWPTYGYDKVEVLSMPFYKLYTPKTAFQ